MNIYNLCTQFIFRSFLQKDITSSIKETSERLSVVAKSVQTYVNEMKGKFLFL